jgi:hypothetical protein
VMSKHEVIPMQVAHGIVADAVGSVIDCLRDFDTIGALDSYNWSASPTRK